MVCTSEMPHTQIFQQVPEEKVVTKENLSLMDDLGLKEKQSETKNLSLFTGEEEQFAFERTISRLGQMMTQDYWEEYKKTNR